MKDKIKEFLNGPTGPGTIAIIVVAVLLVFALASLVANCLVAWLVSATVSGFGYPLPFWPTVGSLYILQLLGGIRIVVK